MNNGSVWSETEGLIINMQHYLMFHTYINLLPLSQNAVNRFENLFK